MKPSALPCRGFSSRIAVLIVIILVAGGATGFILLSSPEGQVKPKLEGYIKVGFTVPLTGPYSELGEEELEGLTLWGKRANETGVNIGGRMYGVQLVYYDDKGDPQQVSALYERLITVDKVDFLVSPPIDSLAIPAINTAEQYKRIIIVVTPGESLFNYRLKYSYQIATPGSVFFTPVLSIAKAYSPNATRIALVFMEAPGYRAMAEGAKVWAAQNGYQVVFEYYYPAGATEFGSIALAVAQKYPDIILGGGGINETMSLVQALYEKGARPQLLALLDAPLRDQFKSLGALADGVMGVSEWEVYATYSPFQAQQLNLTWYGPSITDFLVLYSREYKGEPGYMTALGFAAGLTIQYGVEKASSSSTEKVAVALDKANLLTLFGVVKFNATPELHGHQEGHRPIAVQWQVREGQLVKVIVAPTEFATGQPLIPLPWG